MSDELQPDLTWLRDVPHATLRRMFDALYRAHFLVTWISDLDALLENVMEEGKRAADAEACSLMLFDADTQELYFRVTLGSAGDQEALRKVRLKLGEGIAGAAAATRSAIIVQDAQNDPRLYKEADEVSQFHTRNLVALPMLDREKLVGVIEVLNKVDGADFAETDVRVMEMFATLAASAIANARLIEDNLRGERMAAIGQAVTGLSHYTKNIITGMSGSVDLIDQGLREDRIELLKRTWPIFRRSAKRISHFVQDMLSFSKPRVPHRDWCDLRAICIDAHNTFAEVFAQRHVEVDLDFSELSDQVFVGSDEVYRLVLNLLTNAADAVAPGTGRVRLSARDLPGGGAIIEVSDNGGGVPEELREQIFEPFFSTKGSRGTGLGLPVTRKIAREHGGDVVVDKSHDGGASFRVTLLGGEAPSTAQGIFG